MRISVIIALVLIATLHSAHAFDCSQPKLTAEFVICGDADLRKVADQRQQAWTAAKARTNAEQRKLLIEEQRLWLRNYPRACGVSGDGKPSAPVTSEIIDCFRRASEGRAAYLNSYRPAASPPPGKVDAAAPVRPPAAAKGYHLKFTFACRDPSKLPEVLQSLGRNDYAYPLSQADCLPVPEGRDVILLSVKRAVAKIRLCSEDAGC